MMYGQRIKQLREMHKITQIALTESVPELKQPQLSRIEKGKADLDKELLALVAANTGVTPEFFERPPTLSLSAHSPQFRARNRLTEGARNSALQWAALVDEVYQQLSQSVASIPIGVKPLHHADPREAAHEVRRWLGFPVEGPLPYLVLAVERIGVTVLGLPLRESNLDAFCAWRDAAPIIALLDGVPGDRLRFTLAHELGHLVLHDRGMMGKDIEAEADAFAAELLTPLNSIKDEFPRHLTLTSLTMLKTKWGVSLKTLIRRARELRIIDQDRATSLYRQISARGWNRAEPGHVPVEKPRAFRKMCEMLYGPGPNVPRLASHACWSEELALEVLARHATSDELPFHDERNDGDSNTKAKVLSLEAARLSRRK